MLIPFAMRDLHQNEQYVSTCIRLDSVVADAAVSNRTADHDADWNRRNSQQKRLHGNERNDRKKHDRDGNTNVRSEV